MESKLNDCLARIAHMDSITNARFRCTQFRQLFNA